MKSLCLERSDNETRGLTCHSCHTTTVRLEESIRAAREESPEANEISDQKGAVRIIQVAEWRVILSAER